ncbi:hypothetical protein QVZ41_05545 [Wenyingzhuangia sp. chi5]|uniref:Uncharacterized protein n=1 Tax=Wenyingzhuangia gilva TaxID=3057677 RepID=A0ABT8VQR3_9FLAO|nr:hypothetical protein [Wenyingzhuangia sp. chi5]MDO3694309.1 hypothetical protein [Wenyingzhuangia sp. chi5]
MNKFRITITLLFITIFSITTFAQDKLNQYKYLSIPKQLSLQKNPNQYNINTILKDYLNKYEFTAFIQGDTIPNHIKPCDILNLDADKSGFLTTKVIISFTDCYGNNVYNSKEGVSRIKEFKPAYYEALRAALKDPNIQKHQFSETIASVTPSVPTTPIKQTTKSTNTFTLEFKGQHYQFKETDVQNEYQIFQHETLVGTLKKSDGNNYTLKAGTLNGTGTFDDFGNFSLTRVNPVNNASITDIMARID